jgi:hypothetical protein
LLAARELHGAEADFEDKIGAGLPRGGSLRLGKRKKVSGTIYLRE